MIFLGFFSLYLFENDIQKGRADVKINLNQVLVHIVVSNVIRNNKYNTKIFLGDKGKEGIQKAYIITDSFGNFNNTIKFSKENLVNDIRKFDDISLILLESGKDSSSNIVGFRGEKFDYNNCKKRNNECPENENYNNIIDSLSEYYPFSDRIEGLKLVKIDENTFNNMNFTCIKDCLKDYAINSLKFYGFLVFGRCARGERVVYILGIPDKFNDYQVIPMANMGAKKFYPANMKKTPENGDLGFWIIFV